MALHRTSVLLLLSSLFDMSLEKEGKMANKKRGKGKKKTFKKRKTKQEPRLVHDMNSCLLNEIFVSFV